VKKTGRMGQPGHHDLLGLAIVEEQNQTEII
jgi:hypothetical protein